MRPLLSIRAFRRAAGTPAVSLLLATVTVAPTVAQSSVASVSTVPAPVSAAAVQLPPARPAAPTPAPARIVPNRTVPAVTPPLLTVRFSDTPTAREITSARVLPEAIRAIGDTSADQDRAVARALEQFARETDRAAALDALEAVAGSGAVGAWRASLLANVATLREQSGFYARAARLWDEAWELARYGEGADAHAVADYAIGKRLIEASNFGQVPVLTARLAELSNRPVRGAATHDVNLAREALASLTYHHDKAIFSGPEALKALLATRGGQLSARAARTITAYHPSHEGTSLTALRALAQEAGSQLAMRWLSDPTQVPVPAIVHFKSNHYSTLVARESGGFRLKDPALGGDVFLSDAALRDEMSGYVLVVPAGGDLPGRPVPEAEADAVVGHCAPGSPQDDDPCGCNGGPPGMPVYALHPMTAAVLINDTPLEYTPPRGPAVAFHLRYNQRRATYSSSADFGNTGANWRHDWLAFVSDNNTTMVTPYTWTSVSLRGESSENYNPYTTDVNWRTRAQLVKIAQDPPRYERILPDGTVEVYDFPDRGATLPNRRVFLTSITDPQGQTLTFTYDSNVRLVALTDALGQVTTLAYEDSADAMRLTKVTDPFGRTATMAYNALGQLVSVTDAIGMSSRFAYDESDFLRAMTTPYGTTQFRNEDVIGGVSAHRAVVATDPEGGTERLEYWATAAVDLPTTIASGDVPAGFSDLNQAMDQFNSLYWNKQAMAEAPGDKARAVITRWLVKTDTGYSAHATTRSIPHSVKRPLESRLWYRYPSQTGPNIPGEGAQPAQVARILSGGATQLEAFTYNAKGMLTSKTDPLARQTTYTYAANGIDVLEVRQVTTAGTDLLTTYSAYDAQHRPGTTVDAAGGTTTAVYNAAGQITSVTNAKNETTTYTYSVPNGYLQSVTGPVSGATTTYTYDSYGRPRTVTDSDGYTVTTDYDGLNRMTMRTYPDATTETSTYERLDLVAQKDRLGRVTQHFYDRAGRRTATRDPLGRIVRQEWCGCGSLQALVDANGNRTSWSRDAQGRVITETRANGTTQTAYTYDLSGRLATVTDPKGQVTTHTYLLDDSPSSTVYANATIATPGLSYTYDPVYRRVTSMVDGIGTTTYTYKTPGQLGAGQVATVDGPLTNDVIGYTYDEVGRVTNRTINGAANTVTWGFDALGRVTSEANVLGTFGYTYDGVTSRLATVAYPNGQTSTYSYFPNSQDHRLQTIHHRYPNLSTLSKFDYTYDAVGNILTWRQQADSTATLWAYGYDPVDQLTRAVQWSTDPTPVVLKRYGYGYDPAGNRTHEQIDNAITAASHDNLNRLLTHTPGGALTVAGTVNEPATVTIQSQPAVVDPTNAFRGSAPTTTGTNVFMVSAVDASGNQRTQNYQVTQSGAVDAFTYDANGNMTSDGTRSFGWNARNQLVTIHAGTHQTEFGYDSEQRRVRIVESDGGIVQSDLRVLWCEGTICEERLTDGTSVVSRSLGLGEQVDGEARYFTKDHLESVREVADALGTGLARYSFDPWGRRTLISGADVTSVGFTGYRVNALSGVELALYRGYDSESGRWLSLDPLDDVDGPNRYSYVVNNPVNRIDALGLQWSWTMPGTRAEVKNGILALWLSCLNKGDRRVYWKEVNFNPIAKRDEWRNWQHDFQSGCYMNPSPGYIRYAVCRTASNILASTPTGSTAGFCICCETCASK